MKVISVIEDEEVITKILKHLGLWEVKPRFPPRNAKSQPLSTEHHIDYSDTQICPSDNGFYVDLSGCDAQAGPEHPADLLP